MKTKYVLLLLAGLILFNACEDVLPERELSNEVISAQTRSISETVSPWFDWEDTTTLFSPFHGNFILPWYNATSVQLPDLILNNYKKEDGWVLVYNTISPSPITEPGKTT